MDDAPPEAALSPAAAARCGDGRRPVLIAGPTGSGKSALATAIARRTGGTVVNADALQVYAPWRILTARPAQGDEALVPHALYGHVSPGADWSVGHWLRAVAPLLDARPAPVIVGGTGLYLSALTDGLAAIPPVPADIRAAGDARLRAAGVAGLLAEIDPETAARIDRANPVRVQRAWEVLTATGRGLASWQSATPPPLLAATDAVLLRLDVPPAVLAPRLAARFDAMLADGALDEVARAMPVWEDGAPWTRAIGASELRAHLQGRMHLPDARMRAVTLTRQYAKRQRTWMRRRMPDWQGVDVAPGRT